MKTLTAQQIKAMSPRLVLPHDPVRPSTVELLAINFEFGTSGDVFGPLIAMEAISQTHPANSDPVIAWVSEFGAN